MIPVYPIRFCDGARLMYQIMQSAATARTIVEAAQTTESLRAKMPAVAAEVYPRVGNTVVSFDLIPVCPAAATSVSLCNLSQHFCESLAHHFR